MDEKEVREKVVDAFRFFFPIKEVLDCKIDMAMETELKKRSDGFSVNKITGVENLTITVRARRI